MKKKSSLKILRNLMDYLYQYVARLVISIAYKFILSLVAIWLIKSGISSLVLAPLNSLQEIRQFLKIRVISKKYMYFLMVNKELLPFKMFSRQHIA